MSLSSTNWGPWFAALAVYGAWEYYNSKNPETFTVSERAKWNSEILREEANVTALREGKQKQQAHEQEQRETERLSKMFEELKKAKENESASQSS